MLTRSVLLQGDRILLKKIEEYSKAELIALFTNKDVKKTYMIPDFKNKNEEEAFFYRLKGVSENIERFVYGIYLEDTFIGFLNEVEKEVDAIELGYLIEPKYWNNGYASEALGLAIKELFRIGYKHVKAAYFEGNEASGRVMQKCGMKLTGEVTMTEYRNKKHRTIYYQIDNPNLIK